MGTPDLDETNRTKHLTSDEDEDTFKSLTPPFENKVLGPSDTLHFQSSRLTYKSQPNGDMGLVE